MRSAINTPLLFFILNSAKGVIFTTDLIRKRGRPKRNIIENSVLSLCVRLKIEDVRRLNYIREAINAESKTAVVQNALKMCAETLGFKD